MSFAFSKAPWLQYLEKEPDYFGVPSLCAHEALLKKHPCHVASVEDECQAPSAASAVADDFEDDVNWDLEGAIELDSIDQVGAKCYIHKLQHSRRAKNRKVPGNVAEAFKVATELINREAPVDAGL